MVAYRIDHGVGRFSTGDMVLVDRREAPEKGDCVVISKDGVISCAEYAGQPNVVGPIIGLVPKGRMRKTA